MKEFTLTNDAVFFGIIDVDGRRYSFLDAPLTVEKLHELWPKYPDYFRRRTESGETALPFCGRMLWIGFPVVQNYPS